LGIISSLREAIRRELFKGLLKNYTKGSLLCRIKNPRSTERLFCLEINHFYKKPNPELLENGKPRVFTK